MHRRFGADAVATNPSSDESSVSTSLTSYTSFTCFSPTQVVRTPDRGQTGQTDRQTNGGTWSWAHGSFPVRRRDCRQNRQVSSTLGKPTISEKVREKSVVLYMSNFEKERVPSKETPLNFLRSVNQRRRPVLRKTRNQLGTENRRT